MGDWTNDYEALSEHPDIPSQEALKQLQLLPEHCEPPSKSQELLKAEAETCYREQPLLEVQP